MEQPPLPPKIVQDIDNRVAECSDYLDKLIVGYGEMTKVGGSAAAQANMVMWFNSNITIGNMAWLTDTLVVAVARLAER